MRSRSVLPLLVLSVLAGASSAWAQSDPLVTPPPNVVLPNANGVPVGPFGGLEAGAYVARVNDPSATWFNPAGTAGFAIVTTNSWQQETNSEILLGTAASGERFGYSASADFSKRDLNFTPRFRHELRQDRHGLRRERRAQAELRERARDGAQSGGRFSPVSALVASIAGAAASRPSMPGAALATFVQSSALSRLFARPNSAPAAPSACFGVALSCLARSPTSCGLAVPSAPVA
jgi:hypothetical protein